MELDGRGWGEATDDAGLHIPRLDHVREHGLVIPLSIVGLLWLTSRCLVVVVVSLGKVTLGLRLRGPQNGAEERACALHAGEE